MDPICHTSRRLYDEHRATLDLLARVERSLASAASDADVAAATSVIRALDRHLRDEVDRHFAFEERELFPRLVDGGETDIVTLLKEDHETLRSVVADLLPLAASASGGTLDGAGWKALQRCAAELAERLVSHIDKEDRGLLPLVDQLIDEDADRDLVLAYTSQ